MNALIVSEKRGDNEGFSPNLNIITNDITGAVGAWKHSLSSSIFSLIFHFTTHSNLCDTGSFWCFTVGTEMFRLTSEMVFSFTSKAIFSLTPTFTELCGDYQHVEAQQSLSTGARTQITRVKTCFTRSVCWNDVWMTLKNAFRAARMLFVHERSSSLLLRDQQLYEGWCSKTEKSLQVNNILSGCQGAKPSSSDRWRQVDSQKYWFNESDWFGWTSRLQSMSWFTRFKKSYCWRFHSFLKAVFNLYASVSVSGNLKKMTSPNWVPGCADETQHIDGVRLLMRKRLQQNQRTDFREEVKDCNNTANMSFFNRNQGTNNMSIISWELRHQVPGSISEIQLNLK